LYILTQGQGRARAVDVKMSFEGIRQRMPDGSIDGEKIGTSEGANLKSPEVHPRGPSRHGLANQGLRAIALVIYFFGTLIW